MRFTKCRQYQFRLCLILAVSLQLFLAVKAQDDPEKKDFRPINFSSPLSRALGQRRKTIVPLVKHIEYIDTAVVRAITNAGKDNPSQKNTPTLTTCNHRDDGWNADVERYFKNRGWPAVDLACVSDIYGAGVESAVPIINEPDRIGTTEKTAFEFVTSHAEVVNKMAKQAIKNAGLSDSDIWTKGEYVGPERPTKFQYSVRKQNCIYDYAAFIKMNGTWYVAERLTNAVANLTRQESQRKFLFEYISKEGENLLMNVSESEENSRNDVSAIELTTSGFVTASGYGRIFPEENRAVAGAIRAGEHGAQQASDATTISNIAILALPLMMNVIPVALIAETNNLGMLVYTLLTDVLTAVPLAIKGVEVLTIGKEQQYSVVTRITGGNLQPAEDGNKDPFDNKAAEMWVAKCEASQSFTVIGSVLLSIALIFMVGGVILELVARKWAKKRKSQNQKLQQTGLPNISSSVYTGGASSSYISPTTPLIYQQQQNEMSHSDQQLFDEEIGASTSLGLEHPGAAVLAMAQGRDRDVQDERRWWRRNRRRDNEESRSREMMNNASFDERTDQEKFE